MSKTTVGLMAGTALGFLDGISAFLTPAVHGMMTQIVLGSTLKGFVTGLIAGYVARRTNSIKLAIVTGLVVGLALSFAAAFLTPDPNGHRYYFQIMLPGAVLGLLAGYASQRFGSRKVSAIN